MKRTLDSLLVVGKLVYFIIMLLLFNLFFGWLFFRFFAWLFIGAVLFVLLLVSLFAGKKILSNPFVKNTNTHRRRQRPQRPSDIIDVEAEVFDDKHKEGSGLNDN